MDIDQIIRRNRRRIVVLTALSALNYALILASFVWAIVIVLILRLDDDLQIGVQISLSVVLGMSVGTAIVRSQLRHIRPRVLMDLKAVTVEPGQNKMLDNLIDGLAIAKGGPRVRIALIDDPAPNALAVGVSPDDTTIVLTTGLLEKCTRFEIEAVLAVKFCNVRRFDTALQSVGLACSRGAIGSHMLFREDKSDLKDWFLAAITWPSMAIAEVVRFASFRFGDFGADQMALATTRHPEALDSAMARLDADSAVVRLRTAKETAPLWFEPVPHRDFSRAEEFRGWQGTPSLAERRKRLPHVRK